MDTIEEVKRLVEGFKTGNLNAMEVERLEHLIAESLVDLGELGEVSSLYDKLFLNTAIEPSSRLSSGFYSLLADHKKTPSWIDRFNDLWVSKPFVRWAYSFALGAFGLVIGLFLRFDSSQNEEIIQLSSEVQEMKEMMMLSMLEGESISDRLKAVSLTNELPDASHKITDALLQTLNNDENVNVRLGALEALLPYSDDSNVRMGLIAAIAQQDSPLVQMSLAETMLALQEKRSVTAFKELLRKDETPDEVKTKINETLEILI